MTLITIYDSPMCCATGVCGANVDQKLVDLAADLDWLKTQDVDVRRINLAQEPMEFVTEPVIKALMDASGGNDLPAILVDGKMVSKARFPARAELAAFVGLAAPMAQAATETTGACCSHRQTGAPNAPAAKKGCCGPDTTPRTSGAAGTTCCS